jgi:hypothetical protein
MIKENLQKLGNNHAGVIKVKNGSTMNYGSIRVEGENFVHYTGKGLREMFASGVNNAETARLKNMDEQSLIKSQHIAITPISEIAEIIN